MAKKGPTNAGKGAKVYDYRQNNVPAKPKRNKKRSK